MPLFYFGDRCRFELPPLSPYRAVIENKVIEYDQRLKGVFRLAKGLVVVRKPTEIEMVRNTAKLSIGRLALEGGVVTRQRVARTLKELPDTAPKELLTADYAPFIRAAPRVDPDTREPWAGYPNVTRYSEVVINVTDAYNVIKSYAQTGRPRQNIPM